MPVIQFLRTARIEQIEDFPKDCERTKPGAFHVRPGATMVVTAAELSHLEQKKLRLLVIRKDDKPAPRAPRKAPDVAADAPAPEMAPLEAPESMGALGGGSGSSDGASVTKKQGKRFKK